MAIKETISAQQGVALIILFLVGNSFIFGLGSRAGNDLWLAFLLAILLSLPMVALIVRLQNFTHGLTFSEGLDTIFGPWFSRFVALVFGWQFWCVGSLVVKDLTLFVNTISLPNTPQLAVGAGFVVLTL